LFVFYLIFSRALGYLSGRLAGKLRLGEKAWVAILVGGMLAVVGGLGWAQVHVMIPGLVEITSHAQEQVQARVEAFKETDLYKTIEAQGGEQLDPERYSEKIQTFAENLLHGAQATGRVLLHLLLGLILAILYLMERKEVDDGLAGIPKESLAGYLTAYFGFLGEAVVLTVKLQVVVALVNAIVTLPVILILGLSHATALMLMVFAFGLVPVVGNFLSGAVLIVLAYLKKGVIGVVVFVISTFLLHKVESYYLNPRLTARHVKLPAFALIASLIIWEHLLGIVGVFISFPALYVALKIKSHFREQDAVPAPVQLRAADQVEKEG
jgi:predicted PurR-regulated permease PerM